MTQPDLFNLPELPASTLAWDDVDPMPVQEPELDIPELQAWGFTSQPGFAPRQEQVIPYGVDCLPTPSVSARHTANQAARDELGSADPRPEVLRAWSGEGGLGGENIDAYYTPARVAALMWRLAVRARARAPLRALEFSCGGGVFLGHAPQGTRVTAVELDDTSARIAQALHPHAQVHQLSFEAYHTRSEDDAFDIVIGNPPYGPRGDTARHDRPDIKMAEQYFLRAALERTAPGGICAVLINAQMTISASHERFRRRLMASAQLVAAYPVPTSAFLASGASVTTVILLFRKHDAGVAENLLHLMEEDHWSKVEDGLLSSAEQQFIKGTRVFKKKKMPGCCRRATATCTWAPTP